MLNIALPKGRLGDQVYELLADIGYACPEMAEAGRKLVFVSPENGVQYMLVKPSDVGIYVEHGVADIGILGKDILEETRPDVYELADLHIGKCRMAVAAPKGFVEDKGRTLRVATKFPNIARAYYARLNRDIEIIHLSGSIEIAPIVGLSDVIVDIVESGSTLRENNLVILTEFMPISARLIANKTSFLFKNGQITAVAKAMAERLRKEEGR